MANPSRSQLSSSISDSIGTGSTPMTDAELAAAFTNIVGTFNNIDPSKKVKVKHVVEPVVYTFE